MENPGESRATVVSIVIIVTLGNDDAFARIKIESESTIEIDSGPVLACDVCMRVCVCVFVCVCMRVRARCLPVGNYIPGLEL